MEEAGLPHQAPEIEAVLPASVAGRILVSWSFRGRCWFEFATGPSEDVDGIIAELERAAGPGAIAWDDLTFAIAGRADVLSGPPYFVFGALRPRDGDTAELAVFLMLGGSGFVDPASGVDLRTYERRMIGGKEVYVGTAAMVRQSEHQRGRPYLYQTDDYMFIVVTELDDWARDALGLLP